MVFTLKAAAVLAALGTALPAAARPIDIQLTMNSYFGQRAYLVAYLVDQNGQYVSTVLTAGYRSRYLADLGRWYRLISRAGGQIDGTSGASIGSGETMSARFDVPDKMLNAGFTLRVESAVENQQYLPNEARVDLNDTSNGIPVGGTGYVRALTVSY